MEQIFFLVLLAVVGLLRWLSQMAEERRNREAEKRAGTPAPNTPVQRAPAETEEERIRRFMEALGVPTANAPIPKAEPKRDEPKPPAAPPKPKVPPIDPFPSPGRGLPIPPVIATPAPPPIPQQRPLPQPPLFPPPPSPAPTAPPPLPTRETTIFAPAAPVEFEVRDVAESIDEVSQPIGSRRGGGGTARRAESRQLTLAARLATSQGLRDAMVLREIFGPPRSMQPLELDRTAAG